LSRLGDIGTAESHYAELAALIIEYDEYLDEADANSNIKGKTLKKAAEEQVAWYGFYDQKRIEVRTIVKYFDMEVERVRGKLFRNFKETHSRELGEREINQYINNEPAYLRTRELQLEVDELYQRYIAVVENWKNRGFIIGHLTRAHVAQVEDAIL
jgi:hypothetical protein